MLQKKWGEADIILNFKLTYFPYLHNIKDNTKIRVYIMETINIKTSSRFDIVDITSDIQRIVYNSNVKNGIVVIFIPHTTAGVSINENADPDVIKDLKNIFNNMIPEHNNYKHMEGNSQAHALSTLTSPSITLIIENGNIVLGTWQDIYFMEYDGPRNRKAHIQIIKQ